MSEEREEHVSNQSSISNFITDFQRAAKVLDLSKLIVPILGLSMGVDITGEFLLLWYRAREHSKGDNIIQAIKVVCC